RRIGEDGSSHGNGHCPILRYPKFADDRVSYQGMCCKHAGGKHAGVKVVSQDVITNRKADRHGDREGKEAKQDTFVPVDLEVVEIKLQAGNKHDVQQTDGGEELDGRIVLENSQAVRTNHHTRNDQADDPGNVESLQQHGRQQDNKQDKRENQDL